MRSYDWCIVQKLSKVKKRLISDNIFVQKAAHENYLPFSRENNLVSPFISNWWLRNFTVQKICLQIFVDKFQDLKKFRVW